MSEWLSVAEVASYMGEEVWSGDASLQQTSVLGPGDGCGRKQEGNTNNILGVMADCCKGRPSSGGNSLGSMSHLQSSRGASFASVLPQTSTHSKQHKKYPSNQAACCPPEKTSKGQLSCGETDESGDLKNSGMCSTEAAAGQNSGLGSLVSRVSWIVQDAGRLLWSSSTVLQKVTKEGLHPFGSCWSNHVVSLVRESSVLSVVKNSHVFSMVKGSFVFSLFKDRHIFSVVKDLPIIQQIHMAIMQNVQSEEAAQMVQDCINPNRAQLQFLTPTQTFNKAEELPADVSLIPEDIWTKNRIWDLQLPQEQDMPCHQKKEVNNVITELLPVKGFGKSEVSHAPKDQDSGSRTLQNQMNVQIFCQTLIEFPDSLKNLQTLPIPDLMDTLQPVISTAVLTSQDIVAVCWLSVAKCSQPKPCPALMILVETGLYTLTTDSGLLVLFHHLPLIQLKEVQISLAGLSLHLMGATEDDILGIYTHSQKLTKELCCAILGIIHPGDNRVSQHPLLHGDLIKMSLNWETHVPDLLLDAGLKVCCQFQKSLADLVYLLHCNMDQEMLCLGAVRLLLYTTVAVCLGVCTEPVAHLLLTDTHLGLVQENAVFHPASCSVPLVPCRPQFHDLTLRQRSDVRCVLVHDEDKSGAVRLDVILSNVRGRGHPESVTKAATPSAHISNSSPHAEVWKLTFSCSSEAACLINHLSSV